MKFQRFLVPIGGAALLILAYNSFGGAGLALAIGAIVMVLLLHFTRMMQVFKRASQRPVGHVDSAVMLNAKLRVGVNLLHVIAMTRSLGSAQSPADQQPELFRWTDPGGSHVTCEFMDGKLVRWSLWRPEPAAEAPAEPPAGA
jgi:hypothetical protein